MNPATSEPAIPSSIVMMTPPGSLPGMNSFARAPTTNPMMSDHKMCILPLPFTSKAAAERVEDKREAFSWWPRQHCYYICALSERRESKAAQVAKLTKENATLKREVARLEVFRAMAYRDPLTGLWNRRF